MSSPGTLTAARYGKDKIRVLRVVRDGAWHTVVEYTVTALLEGAIDPSYTDADNSVIVATDSIKNITYYLAKVSPHILDAERFALHLGTHLVSRYAHITKAHITVAQLRWARIPVGDARTEHPHSFYRDGEDRRVVYAEVDATKGKDKLVGRVTSGIQDLLVLKSTGSSFAGFIRDDYTTLAEVPERIFATAIDLTYTFAPVTLAAPTDDARLAFGVPANAAGTGGVWDAPGVAQRARAATLEVFAEDESASVQATLYKMAQRVLKENARVLDVAYELPNKHFVPVDMRYIGVENVAPKDAEVFVPLAAPSGLICATVTRKDVPGTKL